MTLPYINWALTVVASLYLVAAVRMVWLSKRVTAEWMRLRALSQIVWAYSKELLDKGVSLPPRCVMCCQILPRHVDQCMLAEDYKKAENAVRMARIRYYRNGQHPPHPREEEPPV